MLDGGLSSLSVEGAVDWFEHSKVACSSWNQEIKVRPLVANCKSWVDLLQWQGNWSELNEAEHSGDSLLFKPLVLEDYVFAAVLAKTGVSRVISEVLADLLLDPSHASINNSLQPRCLHAWKCAHAS